MKFGIVVFPGTWSDADCQYAIGDVLGQPTEFLWHKDTDLRGADCIVLPGGFSYGDYLRCGAIARFSPVMQSVAAFAHAGGLVIGICNGFQILCEAGLLPGVLMRNRDLRFHCQTTWLHTETRHSAFTRNCDDVIAVPISHGEGNYYADDATLDQLRDEDRIAFRYVDRHGERSPQANPNGSRDDIAGILNAGRNVLGMMPHPERVCEDVLGGDAGLQIFSSIVRAGAASLAR